jgi:hypothetical protein
MIVQERSARCGLFLLYTALLFASFNHDVFRLTGNLRAAHIGTDSYLVLNRLQMGTQGVDPWHPMAVYAPDSGYTTYTSQMGLQGIIASGVARLRGIEPIRFAHLCASACALMTAGMLAIFFVSAARLFGLFAANMGAFFTALAPIFSDFAPSLYWCSFLLFAPFVCLWVLYPCCNSSWKRCLALWLTIFLLVLIKCLCGYEYITTLALSVVVPVAFHRYRAGELCLRRAPELVAWVAAGGAGFLTAIGLHIIQLRHVLGADGVQKIFTLARHRIYAGDARVERPVDFGTSFSLLPEEISYPLNCFFKYFSAPALTLPGGFRVDVWMLVLLGLGMAGFAFARRREASLQVRSLGLAAGISLLTSLSWQVAAINHMCVHFHLNQIVFWAPFLLIVVLTAGYLLQQLAARCQWDRRLLILMGPACVLLVLFRVLQHVDQQIAQQVIGPIAERRVLAALGGPQPEGAAPGLVGCIDQVAPGTSRWCPELARSALVASPHNAHEIVVTGWAVDTQSPASKKSIVVMQGHEVLPARRLVFFERPDVSAHLKLNASKAGFTVSVSPTRPANDTPLRVFVVAGKDVSRIAEISRH